MVSHYFSGSSGQSTTSVAGYRCEGLARVGPVARCHPFKLRLWSGKHLESMFCAMVRDAILALPSRIAGAPRSPGPANTIPDSKTSSTQSRHDDWVVVHGTGVGSALK